MELELSATRVLCAGWANFTRVPTGVCLAMSHTAHRTTHTAQVQWRGKVVDETACLRDRGPSVQLDDEVGQEPVRTSCMHPLKPPECARGR